MPKPARTSCGISYLPVHDTGMDTVRESPLPPSTPSAWLNSLARDVFPRVGNVAVARSTAPMYWRSSPLLAQDADRPADASAHPPFPLARGQGKLLISDARRPARDSDTSPAPRSVPGGAGTRTHICPRVRRGNSQKENQRGEGPHPRRSEPFLASGFWLLASGFWLLASGGQVACLRLSADGT